MSQKHKGGILKTLLLLLLFISGSFALTTGYSYVKTREPYPGTGYSKYILGWPYPFYYQSYSKDGPNAYIKHHGTMPVNVLHDGLIAAAAGSLVLFLFSYRKRKKS